ncbi:microtubule-associated protein CRIPT domain-containing protein [Hirsutella rhossiliensis]|uniref:Cysteine-rich PDZ-binding protein n=1 Tax=Hirsutella rhossiliensis TaxID=111463 RepID=A0A9P8SJE4_9HYPO|nr:microtubule-associated protein CRIPT domain-containing protein [Hirsutella rhossiliensis]KAH0962961.1 microtubule-associated protein CRIPT domain-containing protein [Hirsutella rhossiliensis]
MVCAKCQKLSKGTTLATPDVKKKSEMYYGSPAASSSASSSKAKGTAKPTTLGNSGISKSKLLSKSAKNPYAQYSSSCSKCKSKITQGHTFCHTCAFKNDACAMCGKPNKKSTSKAPVVSGQKFTLK